MFPDGNKSEVTAYNEQEFDQEMEIEKHEILEDSIYDINDISSHNEDDAQSYPICKKMKLGSPEDEYIVNEGEKIKSIQSRVSKSYKNSLKRNYITEHCKTKPFKCSKCDYSCAKKDNMTVHVSAVHDKEKPFKCRKCDYSCALKSYMTMQVSAVHNKEKLFKCSKCNYYCALKSNITESVIESTDVENFEPPAAGSKEPEPQSKEPSSDNLQFEIKELKAHMEIMGKNINAILTHLNIEIDNVYPDDEAIITTATENINNEKCDVLKNKKSVKADQGPSTSGLEKKSKRIVAPIKFCIDGIKKFLKKALKRMQQVAPADGGIVQMTTKNWACYFCGQVQLKSSMKRHFTATDMHKGKLNTEEIQEYATLISFANKQHERYNSFYCSDCPTSRSGGKHMSNILEHVSLKHDNCSKERRQQIKLSVKHQSLRHKSHHHLLDSDDEGRYSRKRAAEPAIESPKLNHSDDDSDPDKASSSDCGLSLQPAKEVRKITSRGSVDDDNPKTFSQIEKSSRCLVGQITPMKKNFLPGCSNILTPIKRNVSEKKKLKLSNMQNQIYMDVFNSYCNRSKVSAEDLNKILTAFNSNIIKGQNPGRGEVGLNLTDKYIEDFYTCYHPRQEIRESIISIPKAFIKGLRSRGYYE